MATKTTRTFYACSFCGKDGGSVRRLIAGPPGHFICNECIVLCIDILDREGIPTR